ncbi:MAG: hypothetical protein ACK4ME_07660, partial [Fimbriimonadales bacterium]
MKDSLKKIFYKRIVLKEMHSRLEALLPLSERWVGGKGHPLTFRESLSGVGVNTVYAYRQELRAHFVKY